MSYKESFLAYDFERIKTCQQCLKYVKKVCQCYNTNQNVNHCGALNKTCFTHQRLIKICAKKMGEYLHANQLYVVNTHTTETKLYILRHLMVIHCMSSKPFFQFKFQRTFYQVQSTVPLDQFQLFFLFRLCSLHGITGNSNWQVFEF